MILCSFALLLRLQNVPIHARLVKVPDYRTLAYNFFKAGYTQPYASAGMPSQCMIIRLLMTAAYSPFEKKIQVLVPSYGKYHVQVANSLVHSSV